MGIALVCLAIFLFACQDAIAKFLFESYPVAFVQLIRFSTLLLLTVLTFYPRLKRSLFKANIPGLAILRGLALATSSLLGGLALSQMPLAECTGIFYLSPFVLLFLSHTLLDDDIGWIGWAATLVGFIGLLVTLRPGSSLPLTGVLLALASMAVGAIYPLLSRILSRSEHPGVLMFYLSLTSVIFFGLQLPWSLPTAPVHATDIGLLLAFGAISYAGHTLFTFAYRFAPIGVLTPFTYLHVGWATLLGAIIFHEGMNWITASGLVLIAAAGAFNALLNRSGKPAPDTRPGQSEEASVN